MDQIQILKRSWKILWVYRALWVFGFLLALTAGGASYNGSSFNGQRQSNGQLPQWQNAPPIIMELNQEIQKVGDDLDAMFRNGIPEDVRNTWIAIAIAVLVVILLLAILSLVLRYVSQVAIIRMVDRYEATGERVGWREGFRLGWSRQAWRLFLIDLVLGIPILVGVLLLFGCAMVPILLSVTSGGATSIPGIVATIGFAFLLLFLMILVGIAIKFISEIIYRTCVLKGIGVLDSIRQGWATVRSNFKDILLLWLVLIGIFIAFQVVLLPVVLVLLVFGGLIGGGLGVGLFLLIQGASTPLTALIWAIVVGGTIFMVILSLPLLFLSGLRLVYFSTVWTLGYRDIQTAVSLPAGVSPEKQVPQAAT